MADAANDKKTTGSKSDVAVLDFAALVRGLAAKHKVSEGKAKAILRGFVAGFADGLKTGQTVRVPGFGAIRVRHVEPVDDPSAEEKSRKSGKRAVFVAAKSFVVAAGLD